MVQIIHGYADYGVESEALSVYGDVTRATLHPRENPHTNTIKADLSDPDTIPFTENQFDFGLFHPVCTPYSDMPDANKNGDAPELVEPAREIAKFCCKEYVVENKPGAPLRDPVTLDARMFGLPVKFERAFETSFPVEQPPRNARLGEPAETSPFFYSERTPEWWRAAKGGIRGDYPKEHLAKNCLPLPFVHHLCRAWLDATEQSQGVADYSNYDEQMDTKRAQAANASLGDF